ncbi:DUF4132 domain-containing protein [Pseudoduganella albidiflava]|uniref:DUF4132 domain-containing protein n=1 Tax=Pseudoduganella albidiflava TaxID=321983 RepID=A0A411WWP4_9BURK|nr:DUF4132 domain-containing protein [Pseudoduganella albidiflava]QBI00927.1 DUF4132 domain-containing protein [Pseudoduganella albidiflava]GGY60725.1 hypothetical protein GCM10007387_49170 [Pseudoduganella albidiflava]
MFKALLGAIGATVRVLRSDESLIKGGVASLDALDTPLGARAAAFIARGDGVEVLADLQAAAPRAGTFLGSPGRLHATYGTSEQGNAALKARAALYTKVDADAPDIPVLVRLGKVLAAADGGASLQRTGAAMPDWLHYLLNDALWATCECRGSVADTETRAAWTVQLLSAIVAHEELPAPLALVIVFEREDVYDYYRDRVYRPLLDPATLDRYLDSHREDVIACAGMLSVAGKTMLCQRLGGNPALAAAFAPLLVELAVGDGKTVRAAAARFVTADAAFTEVLERVLAEGPAGQRANAAELLARVRGADALPALEAALALERGKAVQQALRDAIGRVAAARDAAGTGLPPPPPLPELEERTLGADALDLLLANHAERLQALQRQAREEAERNATAKHRWDYAQRNYDAQRALKPDDFRLALAALNGDTGERAMKCLANGMVRSTLQHGGRLAARADFGIHQALRWFVAASRNTPFWYDSLARESIGDPEQVDLRQLAQLSRAAGLAEDDTAFACLNTRWIIEPPQAVLPPHRIWPYFADHPEYIDAGLGMAAPPAGTRFEPELGRTLEVLRTFPAIAPRWLPRLMELALGEGKTHRLAAQDVLGAVPDIGRQVCEALGSSKQEVRIEAAQWLARMGWREAVPALRAALAKESRESASAAMLSALETLGEDIAPLLAPERLLAQATKALKGKAPAGLAWLDLSLLPACSWQDGTPVPPEVIQWWVVVACKLKEPGGNPLFDRYLALLDGASRARLGSHLLLQFIAHDTRHPSHEEAAALASQQAPQQLAQYQALAQRYPDYYAEEGRLTLDQVAERIARQKMAEYLGTAIGEKGILALASGMPGHAMAAIITQYMRDHYPRRAQVEALVEAAAASDDPAAIQFVLAIARRYRTASVQERARVLVERIAARNGWTQDELADRTIPTGGLDETGTLRLCYGARDFTVTLDAAMKIVLRNPEGKGVAALPAPRQDDDADAAREAKQQLALCRKEVKQVVAIQAARLYEAMCAGRIWPAAEWREYLQAHPLAGRLVQRLVWLTDDGIAFRPTEDGSLVDTNDDEVTLRDGATVRLAHACLLDAAPDGMVSSREASAKAWQVHFKDYKVVPLFAQMTRAQPALDLQQNPAQREIADRQGWLSDAFTLRGAFTKLGYQRAPAEDGGVFTSYHKDFPATGIRVAIDFTGSMLPEENIPAAVTKLGFYSLAPRRAHQPLPLGGIPPVLLAEAYGDYHAVAGVGAFDEQWEKKAQW